jgi:GTPase SAR1 family protein
MKIAFIGSHGVGKTTLCYELAARLKRQDRTVELVMEVARRCPLPINRETTLPAQAWILHTQVADELAATAAGEFVVCDRAVLDNYAYLVHQAGRQAGYDALVAEWMGSYDALFKVPVVEPPTFDGRRDVSTEFQGTIDRLIDELLRDLAPRHHALEPARRHCWVDDVLTTIGLPLHPPQTDLFRPGQD